MTDIIDQNFNLHACTIPGATEGMKVFHLPGMSYVDSGLSCDTFNIIHINNGSILKVHDFIHAIKYYRNKNFTYCIWLNEQNLTTGLKTIFIEWNIKEQNIEPGMALNLNNYQLTHNPLHKQIQQVSTAKQVKEFAEVLAQNWQPPDANVISYYSQTAGSILKNNSPVSLAIFYHDFKPVSVVEMFSSNKNTLGIYGLATLKNYRKKGIGSALFTYALNEAKNMGFQKVVLQASDDGIGIYQKMGFKIKTNYFEFAEVQ